MSTEAIECPFTFSLAMTLRINNDIVQPQVVLGSDWFSTFADLMAGRSTYVGAQCVVFLARDTLRGGRSVPVSPSQFNAGRFSAMPSLRYIPPVLQPIPSYAHAHSYSYAYAESSLHAHAGSSLFSHAHANLSGDSSCHRSSYYACLGYNLLSDLSILAESVRVIAESPEEPEIRTPPILKSTSTTAESSSSAKSANKTFESFQSPCKKPRT